MPLTDTACKNAKCPEGRAFQRFSDAGGLYLEATKTGARLWRWKYRYTGKEKRLALGAYPGVSLKPLAKHATRRELNSLRGLIQAAHGKTRNVPGWRRPKPPSRKSPACGGPIGKRTRMIGTQPM